MNELLVSPEPLEPKGRTAVMKDALRLLDPVGGFDLVSTTVDKAENLDPNEPVMKEIFLTEAESEAERRELKNRLRAWIDLLGSATNAGEMVEKSEAQAQATQQLLHANVKTALDASRKLEENYRSVAMFYKNAAGDKPVRNVSLVNAPLEQIKDLNNPLFFNAIANELRDKYDRLDLMNNYSLLVLPGYLGSKAVIDKWARLAHENKVMLVTDFRNLNSPEQVIKLFEAGKFTGSEDFRANVMLTCNWLVGRERAAEAGEEAPLYIPPSTALAGRMYANNLAQVTAGKKYGALYEVQGVKFDVRANVLEEMVSMGLVPMVYEFGQVQAFSPKTLFNGTNLGLQTYSVVRTFDWLTKSI
ncbi:MAG: type VI secretion system contractile sheath protein TssC, partial [Cytophagales bacterium]|nr:type VI secretion system contractile sheath protein TssC [Cytophagales bacterium]